MSRNLNNHIAKLLSSTRINSAKIMIAKMVRGDEVSLVDSIAFQDGRSVTLYMNDCTNPKTIPEVYALVKDSSGNCLYQLKQRKILFFELEPKFEYVVGPYKSQEFPKWAVVPVQTIMEMA